VELIPVAAGPSTTLAAEPFVRAAHSRLGWHTRRRSAVLGLDVGGPRWVSRRAAGAILSRKGAKSRTGARKLRSTRAKTRTRVAPSNESQAALITKLKAHARDLEKKLEARAHELAEALEQQTATSAVLRVISTSSTDTQPVFNAILESATELCAAETGILF